MLRARGNSLAALRSAVGRGLSERETGFLVIDEAAHIIRQTRGTGKLEIQLDTLKSLANEGKTKTQMVLIGSYDLYRLMSLSGQLARRTHVLHFERYRDDRCCVYRLMLVAPRVFWREQHYPPLAWKDNYALCKVAPDAWKRRFPKGLARW